MTKHLLLMTCASGALGLFAGAAQAATATATATDQGATNVTELVVTAEHREQSLQKVPVAIAVFTAAERDTIGITSVQEFTNFAPGFVYDAQTTHAYLRGVGRQSVNVTNDARVATYEDEFYVYSPYNLDKSSLFLTQEQVERGPQNVGGRNAIGGSIDMLSVRPTDSPYAELRATVANFGTYNIEGAASGQLAPGLDVRIAGFDHNQDSGYYTNVLGGPSEGNVIHEWYLEGQVDYKPTDNAEFYARAFTESWNNGSGDAGSRTGIQTGSWDETNLSDANSSNVGGLWINPNYGYSDPSINPAAAAAVAAAHLTGGDTDALVVPGSTVLIRPGILNNPVLNNPDTFAGPITTKVKLSNFDGYNSIFTYHFPTFDFKYTAGAQGYDYDLTYGTGPGGAPAGNGTDVSQFALSGGQAGTALNNFFGGAFPGCAACGFGGTALPAGTNLAGGNLIVHPNVSSTYIEDDWWTAHDVTFQSTTDSPLQWTAGAFFYFQHYNQPYEVRDTAMATNLSQPIYAPGSAIVGPSTAIGGPCPVAVSAVAGICGFTNPLLAPANPRDDIGYFEYQFNVQQEAAYGELSYKFNDQWSITGNLRYTRDERTGSEASRYVFFGSAYIDAGLLPFYGSNLPAVDITVPSASSPVCPTGTPNTGAHPNNCTTGPLAPGVTSAGVLMPNGFMVRQLGATDGAMTGGAGIEFQPTNNIFTYFRYSRGFEPASFTAGETLADPEVKPEFLNSYEIGYKENFGKSLLVNLAAFYYDYDGMQLPISISVAGLTLGQFINVPKAVSEGVEAEAYWSPVKDLLVTFSYSYDHTAILTGCTGTVSPAGVLTPAPNALCLLDTNDPAAVQPGRQIVPGETGTAIDQGVKGNELPNAPANKVAVDLAYTWHFTPGSLTLSGTYVWRDTQTGSVFQRSYNTAPAWDDVDFRALWKGPQDKYEVIAYVKNVFNTLQYSTGGGGVGLLGTSTTLNSAATGLAEGSVFNLAPPRTFGVEVRYKFF